MAKKESYSERNLIKKLISDRIECIKKCKSQLSSKVNKIIDSIKELEKTQQDTFNSLISGWEELLRKFPHYNQSELFRIKKIKSVTIRCLNKFGSINIENINNDIKEFLYEIVPLAEVELKSIHNNFLSTHCDKITVFLKSNDSSSIFIGGYDGIIRKLSSDYMQERIFDLYFSPVTCLAVSSCGNYLASGSKNQGASVFLLSSPEEVYYLSGHQSKICRVSFSTDGNYIVTGSQDKIIIHDIKYNLNIINYNLCGESSVLRKFGSSEYFTSSDDSCFYIFKLNQPKNAIKKINKIFDTGESCAFSESGKYFVGSEQLYNNECHFYVMKTNLKIEENNDGSDKKPLCEFSCRKMKKKINYCQNSFERKLMAIDKDYQYVAYYDKGTLKIWNSLSDEIVNSMVCKNIKSILGVYACWALFTNNDGLVVWDFCDFGESEIIYEEFKLTSFSDYSYFKSHLLLGCDQNISVHEFPSMIPLFNLDSKSYKNISSAAISKEKDHIYVIFLMKVEKWDYMNQNKIFKVKMNQSSVSKAFLTEDEKFLGIFSHSLNSNYVIETKNGDLCKYTHNLMQALFTMYGDSFDNSGIIYYQIMVFYFTKYSGYGYD